MDTATDREPGLYAVPGSADYENCDHEGVRTMGSDGGTNRYFECLDCGSVLVQEGLLGGEGEGGSDDLGEVDPRLGDLLDDIDAHYAGEPTSFGPGRAGSLRDRLAAAWRLLR